MHEDGHVQGLLHFAAARATKIMADDWSEDDGDPPSLQSADDNFSVSTVDSDSSEGESPTGISLPVSALLPPLEDILPPPPPESFLPAPVQALHHLPILLRELQVSAVEFYKGLAVSEVSLSTALPPKAHVDGGALASTTNRLDYLWSYYEYTSDDLSMVPHLRVADDTLHQPSGYGFLKVPMSNPEGVVLVKTFYTPAIPATILSPDALGRHLDCRGYGTYSDFVDNVALLQLTACSPCNVTYDFALQRIRGLLFTNTLIAPTASERAADVPVEFVETFGTYNPECLDINTLGFNGGSPTIHEGITSDIRTLTAHQKRSLWHLRLGHVHEPAVCNLHKFADGVPAGLPRSDTLHKCPFCVKAKLHRSSSGPSNSAEPTDCWQDVQIDFGFFVQQSTGDGTTKKSKRKKSKVTCPTRSQPSPRPLDTMAILAVATSTKRRSKALRRQLKHAVAQEILNLRGLDDDDPRFSIGTRICKDFGRNGWHHGTITAYHPEERFYTVVYEDNDSEDFLEEEIAPHIIYGDRPSANTRSRSGSTPAPVTPSGTAGEEELWADNELPNDEYVPDPEDTALPTDSDKVKKAKARFERLKGLNGETCYVLVTDRKSGACLVSIRRDKTPPIDFFRHFLATYSPDVSNKTVRFDGGGELGRNIRVCNMFQNAGYTVDITGTDSSSQNGLVERPHRTIGDAVRTMLYSAKLEPKFWPYALRHFIHVYNQIPHGDREEAPSTICTGRRPNLSLLRVWGCRIYALPPTKHRSAKADVDTRTGIFLGYHKTMKNAYYYDVVTKTVKQTSHVSFDEGFNDQSPDERPPYVKFLHGTLPPEVIDLTDTPHDFGISLSPFLETQTVSVPFRHDADSALPFDTTECPRYMRAFAHNIKGKFGKASARTTRRNFEGAYILRIGERSTYSVEDVQDAIAHYRVASPPPAALIVEFATDRRADLREKRPPPLSLRPVDIRRIASLNLTAGEGPTDSRSQRTLVQKLAGAVSRDFTPPDPDDEVTLPPHLLLEMRKLQNDHMTDEEKKLSSFSRKNLMRLSNWEEWRAADHKQLDSHFDAGTIGKAVPRPIPAPNKPSQVFRLVWARLVKAIGVRKSRACLDGSKRAAPWLRQMVQTYASCIELPCLRLFLSICAQRGYYITYGDVENAYQQSPPPSVDCYLEIDDTIEDWYLHRFKIKLNRLKEVIPLFKALQGHPEAGALWERMISDIMINKLGFTTTTHERNIYSGTIDGHEILVCRQVDDFAAGSSSKEGGQLFIDTIRKYVAAEFAGMGIETKQGVYQLFNGIDINQTKGYIKIGCESYIDRVLKTHGWDEPSKIEPHTIVPLYPSIVDGLMTVEGPPEKSPAARELERKNGFSYRNLLGELIYAYVICRIDIGFAVCFLSRFSSRPHHDHFVALRNITKYLRATKDWGIIYRRPKPLTSLPDGDFNFLCNDPELPVFPDFDLDVLVGILDASHGTDLHTRRSVTGIAVFYGGAAVAWKSKLQSWVSTSSTEAEFLSAVQCAKIVIYLRSVLQELKALKPGPSPLLIDNEAALKVINERRPTPRVRHVNIQQFAIQEWREAKLIVMQHLPGIVNSSDDLTKALSWVLHGRHARRNMGHYAASNSTLKCSTSNPYTRGSEHKAGEGVGDNLRAPSKKDSELGTGEPVTSTRAQDHGALVNGHSAEEGEAKLVPLKAHNSE